MMIFKSIVIITINLNFYQIIKQTAFYNYQFFAQNQDQNLSRGHKEILTREALCEMYM